MNTLFRAVAVAACLAAASLSAAAAVQSTEDYSVFSAAGTMTQVTTAADVTALVGNGLTPANGLTFTDRGLTFPNAAGWLVGTAAVPYNPVESVYAANPILGAVTHDSTLLGFEFGYLGVATSEVQFSITTTTDTYHLTLAPTLASQSLSFVGFQADAGEYFRSFSISSPTMGAYPVLSAVQLGVAAAVPEPETYALLLAGLGVIGSVAKRRSRMQG